MSWTDWDYSLEHCRLDRKVLGGGRGLFSLSFYVLPSLTQCWSISQSVWENFLPSSFRLEEVRTHPACLHKEVRVGVFSCFASEEEIRDTPSM